MIVSYPEQLSHETVDVKRPMNSLSRQIGHTNLKLIIVANPFKNRIIVVQVCAIMDFAVDGAHGADHEIVASILAVVLHDGVYEMHPHFEVPVCRT